MQIGRIGLLTVLSVATLLRAGTAKGTLTWDGKTYELKHAYAITATDTFDKKKQVLRLLVTSQPLDESVVRSRNKLLDLGFNRKIEAYIDFEISADGESSNYSVRTVDQPGNISGSSTPSSFKISSRTETRIEGESTKEASKVGDSTYEFSFKAEADILKPIVVPPPTAADASAAAKTESAKAYLAFNQAMMSGNKAALLQGVVAEKAKMMDTPDFAKMLAFIQKMQPRQIRVRKAFETADSSKLWVSGVEGAKPVKGVVELVKEDGKWKVGRESWGEDWE